MITAHQFHRLTAQNPRPIELAIIDQHLAEASVIIKSPDETRSAQQQRRLLFVTILRRARKTLDAASLLGRRKDCHPIPFLLRNEESRGFHLYRPATPFFQQLVYRSPS